VIRFRTEHGSILVLTLWVVALLAIMAASLTRKVRFGLRVTEISSAEVEAREMLSALGEYCVARLEGDADDEVDSPQEEWAWPFTAVGSDLFSELTNAPSLTRDFRVEAYTEDERGKVNVNFSSVELLTEVLREAGAGPDSADIAAAIVDWRDPDFEGLTEDLGSEKTEPSYSPSNRDLRHIEELLFVRGITPSLFFGEDANHNRRLDREEDDGELFWPPDNSDGLLQPGLADLMTVYGSEDGIVQINVNTASEPVLRAVFRSVWDDRSEAETLAAEMVGRRQGRGGAEFGESFHPFESEGAIAEVLEEAFLDRASANNVAFVVGSNAFRFFLRASLPEEHVAIDAEMVVKCEEGEIQVVEWHE